MKMKMGYTWAHKIYLWEKAVREFEAAKNTRDKLFEDFKRQLGCNPEFGYKESMIQLLKLALAEEVLNQPAEDLSK